MVLDFPVAGIGSRFLALAVDTLIQAGVAIVFIILVAVLGVSGSWFGLEQHSIWLAAAAGFFFFVLLYGYFAIFEILWNGQTPGKRVVGIRVVKESGRPLTAAEAIGRNLMRIVDQLPGFYGVGMLVALIGPVPKRLGDLVVGAVVVRESSFHQVKPLWQTEAPPPTSIPDASLLTMEDLKLLDTFLHRRHDLTPDVRARMADQILARVAHKVVLPPVALPAEMILEALAYARRSSAGMG